MTRTDQELLAAAIERSGLSSVRFATEVMSRTPTTIRRWRGGRPMPAVVRAWLERYLKR